MQLRYSPRSFVVLAGLLGFLCFFWGVPVPAAADAATGDPAAEPKSPPPTEAAQSPAAAGSVESAGPSAEAVALEAQRVHTEYCGSLQGTDRGLAGESFAVVGPAWSRVSAAYRESGGIYLRYWSGLLSECLGRRQDAIADLEAFLAHEDSRILVSMRADAQWRLRRKASGRSTARPGVKKRRPSPRKPRAGAGAGARVSGARFIPAISLGVAAVAAGITAAAQWDEAVSIYIPRADEGDEGTQRSYLDANIPVVTAHQNTAQLGGAIAAGLAVSSAVSFLVAAAVGARSGPRGKAAAAKPGSQLLIAPGPDSVFVGVSTRW